jgi:hypothetical protein
MARAWSISVLIRVPSISKITFLTGEMSLINSFALGNSTKSA